MKKFIDNLSIFTLFLLLFFVVGCNNSSEAAQTTGNQPEDVSVASATKGAPSLTPSPVPPTMTATNIPATATDTLVPTLTETPTDVPPSPTPTVEPPVATVFGYTVCRFGPGTIYPVHTIFEEEGSALVRGRLEDDSWYLIELPDEEQPCWIFNEIVQLDRTASGMPVLTPPPKPTPAPAPTQSEEEKALGLKYFLIIPDNGGPFACGDGMAYFYSGKKGKDSEDDIAVALDALFSVKTEYVGNFYNPVYKSRLKVKDVELENGHATIWLGGNFVKPKTDCEAKRIHLQVWETARQFSEVKHRPVIWVNNVLLGDLLEHVQK